MLGLFALRALTVKALRGKTLAGAAVHPSTIMPVDALAASQPAPVVLIFTDEITTPGEGVVEGRDLIAADYQATLAFEVAVATAVAAEDGSGNALAIPETDEGFELTLDLIHRGIVATLQCDRGAWAELWRRLVTDIRSLTAVRGAGDDKGTRFAARRIELRCGLVADPVPGEDLPALWTDMLAAFAADAELAPLAPMLQAAAAGTPVPAWEQAQAALGLAADEIGGIGLAPADLTASADAAALTGITAQADDGDDMAIDEATADDVLGPEVGS